MSAAQVSTAVGSLLLQDSRALHLSNDIPDGDQKPYKAFD